MLLLVVGASAIVFLYGVANLIVPFGPLKGRGTGLALAFGALVWGAFMAIAVSPDKPPSSAVIHEELVDPGSPAPVSISVPSDIRARYYQLALEKTKTGNAIIVTRRVGPSGTSHSRRECSCPAVSWRYLGDGETLADAMKDRRLVDEMRTLEPASNGAWPPSFYICVEACRVLKLNPGATPDLATRREVISVDRGDALTWCSRYVKSVARFPSSVEVSGWSSEITINSDGTATVSMPFTALNALGANLPHKAVCRVSADGRVKGHILEN